MNLSEAKKLCLKKGLSISFEALKLAGYEYGWLIKPYDNYEINLAKFQEWLDEQEPDEVEAGWIPLYEFYEKYKESMTRSLPNLYFNAKKGTFEIRHYKVHSKGSKNGNALKEIKHINEEEMKKLYVKEN